MKKLFALVIMAAMLCSMALASAEDLGVQVIGGPDTAAMTASLDDMQLDNSYTIDGYARIKPVEFQFVDFFAQFNKDANYSNVSGNRGNVDDKLVFVDHLNKDYYYNWRWWEAHWNDSGVNADFAWLMLDVTNLQKKGYDFTGNVTVKAVYQDDYEFSGWVRQVNYDYINYGSQGRDVCRYGWEQRCPNVVVLDPANVETIDMLYTGTYAFGVTLPNSVVEDTKSPLALVITLDGNELTYNIRK